jgi:hypothetical protein
MAGAEKRLRLTLSDITSEQFNPQGIFSHPLPDAD